MRDRDAAAILAEIAEQLTASTTSIVLARGRLRTWRADGFPPGRGADGAGGSSGESHTDPVAQTVQALELRDKERKGEPRTGWRDDLFDAAMRRLDAKVFHLRDAARDLARDLESLLTEPDQDGDPGCALCNAVRLPVNGLTSKVEHECDDLCRSRDHRHPSSYQPIHNRRAPKPTDAADDPLDDVARCQFHYDFAARMGIDAHPQIGLHHLEHGGIGYRVPKELMLLFHPQEFARHQARMAGLKGANGRATATQQREGARA